MRPEKKAVDYTGHIAEYPEVRGSYQGLEGVPPDCQDHGFDPGYAEL